MLHPQTPIPRFTVYPSCWMRSSNCISITPPTPSPESSSRTGPVDKPGSLIIHFPIINHHCFNTMSPKKSQRQQRKHLPLSRQGTNSRIRESASLHTQDWKKHKHMHIGHAFIPSDVVFFLCYKTRNSSCFRT